MNLILLSTITGQRIERSMERLAEYSVKPPRSRRLVKVDADGHLQDTSTGQRIDSYHSGDIVWACLEDSISRQASRDLALIFPQKKSYTLREALLLPYPELTKACESAFASVVSRLRATGADLAFLALHPVLYHQQTTELISLYNPTRISQDLAPATLKFVISLHDDIFDIHRNLLPESRLYGVRSTRRQLGYVDQREAFLDIDQQRFLLGWRASELAEARRIATLTGATHYLLHQKCRLSTFWSMVIHGDPSIYLSHPISQPRRDITGVIHPKKCRVPDPARGHAFIAECNALADALAESVAIVEPTNIDELRLADRGKVDVLSKTSESDLTSAIMPPLTERWPVTSKKRLEESPSGDELSATFLPVPAAVFKGLKPGGSLEEHRSALRLLRSEIKRQIDVRDITLAEQADLILVYRPFTEPDSPDASGGVTGEITTAARKAALGRHACQPPVLMIHPLEDERRRRRVYFEQEWDKFVETYCGEAIDDSERKEFKAAVLRMIEAVPYNPDTEEIRTELATILVNLNIAVIARLDKERGAITEDTFGAADRERDNFISAFVMGPFLVPSILRDFGDVIRAEDLTDTAEIARLVREILSRPRVAVKD